MSEPTTHADRSYPSGADDSSLRQRMQEALAQPHAQEQPYAKELGALQSRVMAQWQQRTASTVAVGSGPAASLRRALGKRPLQMGLASLALVAIVAVQTSWMRIDPALDELMEPDVLSLITLGEL